MKYRVLIAVLAACTMSASASLGGDTNARNRREVRQDHRELHQDRRQVPEDALDVMQLQNLSSQLRAAAAEGDTKAISRTGAIGGWDSSILSPDSSPPGIY